MSLLRILNVEDNKNDSELIQAELATEWAELEIVRVETRKAFTTAVAQGRFDLIICDYTLPDFDGISALAIAKKNSPDTPFIFVSGTIGEDLAIEALKKGASDYVLKNRLSKLVSVVHRALNEAEEKRENKRSADALLSSRDLLKSVIENVPARVFWKDEELRYLGCNSGFARDAGFSRPEDLLGKDDFQMGWREQAELYRADDKQVMGSDTPKIGFEEPQTTPDGHTIWLRTSKVPMHDTNGKVFALLGIYEDITDHKQAEEEIKFKNTILQTQQETSLDAILVVDENSRIISYNHKFIALWRLSPQLVNSGPDALVLQAVVDQAENPEAFAARFKYLYEHRDDKSREEVNLKDGRLIDRYSAPITGADGKYYGRVWYFRDITKRKQAEQELRESERRFNDLLENVELISMMLDRDGRVTYCNEYLLRLSGWQRGEVIGRNWFDLFVPPEISNLRDEFFAALLANRPEAKHHENDILMRSGGRRLIRWSNSVLRSVSGDVIGTASIGEDITEQKNTELALSKKRTQLSEALKIARLGYWEYEFATDEFIFNDQYYSLHKITAEDAGGYRMSSAEFARRYVYPEDAPNVAQHVRLAFETVDTDYSAMTETRILSGKGEIAWLEVRLRVEKDALGRTIRLVGVNQDITERKAAEVRIKYLNRIYAMLSGINTLIVRVHDRDELFREACRIAVEAGGFRMAMIAIVDRSMMKIIPVATAGKDEALMTGIKDLLSSSEDAPNTMVALAIREKKTVVSNDSLSDPRVLLGKKYAGSGVRSMAVFSLIVSDEAIGALAMYASEIDFFHDDELKLLTELAGDIAFAIDHLDKQERLNYLAYYDALTGLANRNLFLERVAQYMRSAVSGGHKLAIGLIDLERFKNINDSLGRPVGDALLKQVTEWLTHRAGDANLLARIDADHFAVVLPEVKSDGNLARLVENLLAAFLEHPFHLNDAVLRIGIKIGVALFPDDGADADTLFGNAEAALKMAKKSGDRYLFHTKKMTETVAAKLTLENQLRQAIDNEEFVLHYQPKVNLTSGKVTSAEALIRWNDPRTGLVPPGRFIPILEETGLIYEVGRWALRKAVDDYLRWRDAGLPAVRIAVNVSPLQLRNAGFIAEIEQVIGIDAHAAEGLELEITESVIMDDTEHNIASLQAVRKMGVTIAIDDFGTGFSSLSYLSKLPVDTLKIDRAFVIEMTAGQEGLALVSTIIGLAHALKLKVVAEGVETEEQSRLLRLLSCDEMQGYLFSKPVPAEIFEARFLSSPLA
ncbi:MAG: EAL domain-containing protein [Gallionella sp.]